MSFNSAKFWLRVAAYTLASPLFAAVFLLTVALMVSLVPFPSSLEHWLSDDMLVRAVSFSLLTALLSIDLMLQVFYLSLPILIGGSVALLRLDLGIQSKSRSAFVIASSMGVLYSVAYLVGSHIGWIEPAFYT